MYNPVDVHWDILNDIISSYYLHNHQIFGLNGLVRGLGSSLSNGRLTGPERVYTLTALIRGIPLIYLLLELTSWPFEQYLKSDILVNYRELMGDDTNDLSNLLQHMLILDPKPSAKCPT